MPQTVSMWVFTWEGCDGTRVEGARTKRAANRLRGELAHHRVGPLVRAVLPIAPVAGEEGEKP